MRLPAAMVIALAVLTPPPHAAAQDISAYYEENCSACHTIGGGPQGGPDLRGVTSRRGRDWLVQFLLDPHGFESDPAVVRLIADAGGMAMPPIDGITRERAEALVAFLAERSVAPAADVPTPGEFTFTPADASLGRALFTGSSRLSGSGPACISCHSTAGLRAPGGGHLGPDLTAVHARLGGSRGLTAWLGAMPTPMMRAVYRNAALTTEEARSLTAYLAAAPDSAAAARSPRVFAAAVALATGVLAAVGFAGRRRFRAVRAPLVRRASLPGGPR